MEQVSLDYARLKGFRDAILKRLESLEPGDQRALMEIVTSLKASENHVRDMLDWLEEIALRDGIEIKDVLSQETFAAVLADPRLGRNDKLNRIKEELRRIRLPRLCRIESEIASKIRALKLGPQVQLGVPAGLEGGSLTVQLKARSQQELKQLLAQLAEATDGEEVKKIFDLLGGKDEAL